MATNTDATAPPLTAGILVVSTTAAQGLSTDASGPALRQVLGDDGPGRWKVSHEALVPDDALLIQKHVLAWAAESDPPSLIVTTGGTGFATADGTPEAIAPLLHKQAPGLVQAMLAASLAVTPFAMMSRPVAGVRHRSVIVTLPGSPKGAKENLEAIIKTLPHACRQVSGADSRALHAGGVKRLEAEAGMPQESRSPEHVSEHRHRPQHQHHHHHHGHGHGTLVRHTSQALSNDPQLGPTRRHRESPYPMLSVDDALALIAEHTSGPDAVARAVDEKLIGLVLAKAVVAQEHVPAFRASIVDGYALVVPDDGNVTGTFPVTSISHATPGEVKPLKRGEVARITTGAPLPPGATSVIMVEDTALKSMTDDGTEEREIEVQATGVQEGENVREVGSDIERGSVILDQGEQITGVGGEIGLLAAVGVAEVEVFRRPVVGVMSTGDEIIDHSRPGPLRLGEVRDTNRVTIISALQEWGFDVVDLGIAKDAPGTLEEALRSGLRQVDVLVTTGGVSMGELDLLKPTVERALGGTIHFGRVAMKPGKPTTFATVPVKDNAGRRVSKAIFSLPGNPASALVTLHLFVLPALHKKSAISPAGLPRVSVVLAHEFPLDPRPEYHRAVVTVGRDGCLTAVSTGGQRSSKVSSLRSANALVCVPSGKGKLEKGTRVDALLMSAIRGA